MTFGPLRASAIALRRSRCRVGFAACRGKCGDRHAPLWARLPIPGAWLHGHGVHGYVAQRHVGHRHYVWRNGHRYAYGYGYNPGAAVAAGVIGGARAAGYPYCGD